MSNYIIDNPAIIAAFASAVTACISANIAYQQYKIEKHRLRLDLYKKRLTVFIAVVELIKATNISELSDKILSDFLADTAEAYFLFDKDILDYLHQLHSNYAEILGITDRKNDQEWNSEDERNNYLTKRREYKQWFRKQIVVSQEKFNKYLNFKRLK